MAHSAGTLVLLFAIIVLRVFLPTPNKFLPAPHQLGKMTKMSPLIRNHSRIFLVGQELDVVCYYK